MKNLLLFLLLTPCFLNAQENCQGSFKEYYLNSNNIRASFFPRGNKFTTGSGAGFNVPFPGTATPSTIFASSPWIGGFDDAGNLKGVSETYPDYTSIDFSVGPLTSIGTQYPDSICAHFDRAWIVFAEDIERHKRDYNEDFIINDTIPSIFGWPGRGNKFSKRFNGFSLPDTGTYGLAPYFDENFNNYYDPENGDYPIVYTRSSWPVIPDQIMWMVFNDVSLANPSQATRPARFEFQLTAFAFHCQDNEILNNTIFNNYRIIDRAVTPLDSVFFGMWTDHALGCSTDDFIGSDSLRSTEFVYNGDAVDGDIEFNCSNGMGAYAFQVPPVQSTTWRSHPMHSFIQYKDPGTNIPIERYRLLNGNWPDGTQMRPGGDGYGQDPGLHPTRYMFNGDPRDTSSWAAINVLDQGSDVSSVSSILLGRLDPGSVVDVELAYTFHYDAKADYLGQITRMFENIDSIQKIDLTWGMPCTRFPLCLDNDCVWPGDFNRDGIVDHRDLLHWGTTTNMSGPARNGQISWRGHLAEDWTKTLEDGTNAKHQDADGNGTINELDLELNLSHFLNKTQGYISNNRYPGGPELVILSDPMNSQGNIGNIRVMSRRPLKDIYGIAFELEFDTFYYTYTTLMQRLPLDSLGLAFIPDDQDSYYGFFQGEHSGDTRYSFVGTNQENYSIEDSFYFLRIPFGLEQKHQLPLQYLPDQFVLRLKNLVAINKDGEDLDFGATPYVVYNPFTTAVTQPEFNQLKVFPNPCQDEVMIVSDVASDVEIVNVQGKKVRTISGSELSFPVNIADLVPGMYFLRFINLGKTLKLIVQ
jgi:hypothetical protein